MSIKFDKPKFWPSCSQIKIRLPSAIAATTSHAMKGSFYTFVPNDLYFKRRIHALDIAPADLHGFKFSKRIIEIYSGHDRNKSYMLSDYFRCFRLSGDIEFSKKKDCCQKITFRESFFTILQMKVKIQNRIFEPKPTMLVTHNQYFGPNGTIQIIIQYSKQ